MVEIKKFRNFDDGTSMVIGVILMVSIVVAITSVVYLSAYGLASGNIEEMPRLEFHIDEKNDRLFLFQSDTIVEWKEISIRSSAPVTILINGEVEKTTTNDLKIDELYDLSNDDFINKDDSSKNIVASDFIDIEGTDGILLNHVSIFLVHKETESIIGIYTFREIKGQDTN